jgi:hypothetical protein
MKYQHAMHATLCGKFQPTQAARWVLVFNIALSMPLGIVNASSHDGHADRGVINTK